MSSIVYSLLDSKNQSFYSLEAKEALISEIILHLKRAGDLTNKSFRTEVSTSIHSGNSKRDNSVFFYSLKYDLIARNV